MAGRPHRAACGAAAVSLVLIAFTSCTPTTPVDPPSPGPSSTAPSATPTENAVEREQRLAYEEAENSFRRFIAEFYRLTARGGVKEASPEMVATATGPYLQEQIEVMRGYLENDERTRGAVKVISFVRQGYSSDELLLRVCADGSELRTLDKRGRIVGAGNAGTDDLVVRKVSGLWKIYSHSFKEVTACGK